MTACTIPYTSPVNPLNAKAIIAATIRAIGFPFHETGVSHASRRSRIVEKIYNTIVNPKGIAIEYVNISAKSYLKEILFNVTFNTTQFVVI